MLLYGAHSWVLLLHWVPLVLTALVSSLVPELKTKMHHKGQITWLQTVSHHQKQTHQPIVETHQLPVRNLHPCRVKSLPKAKGKRCPFPRRRGTTIRPLFYLLHIPVTCRVILLTIWLCFKGPLVITELFIKCMNTAPVNLILKQYPGFEMNTAATSERRSERATSCSYSTHLHQNPTASVPIRRHTNPKNWLILCITSVPKITLHASSLPETHHRTTKNPKLSLT